ncbi:MAG: HD domain-containing protein [Treponema sp.]|nr:HD domain-containing protein [Treponema sp.]
MNFIQLSSLVLAEYLIITGVLVMFVDFLITLFSLLIRTDVIFKRSGIGYNSNIALLAFEILFIFCSVIVYSRDTIIFLFALPLLAVSIVFTIMLFWGFSQLRGLSDHSMEILETLVGVIEAGDENLDGHSLHVQNLAMLIYDYLPFKDRLEINRSNLQYAALFLDVGKLGIPREIIDKKGKLFPDEKMLIRRHPEICVQIFEKIPSFKTVTHWIKYHHERVDGNGYYKLRGDEIPLASRILAVADTYSAITMERSYRASLPYENAVAELRLVSGTQLDAELVTLFCSIPKHKVTACMDDVRGRMKKYQAGDFKW